MVFLLCFSALLTPGGDWIRGYERCLCNRKFLLGLLWSRFSWDLIIFFIVFSISVIVLKRWPQWLETALVENICGKERDKSSWSSDRDSGYFLTIKRQWPDPSLKLVFFHFQFSPISLVMVSWHKL